MARPTTTRTVLEMASFHIAALFVAGTGALFAGIGSGWAPAIVGVATSAWLSRQTRAFSIARWRTRDTAGPSKRLAFAHLVPMGIAAFVLDALADGASLSNILPVVAIVSGIPLALAALLYCSGLYRLWQILRGEQTTAEEPRP